jgi:hypothetical protein
MNDAQTTQKLENGLQILFPQPDKAFLDRLEDKLVSQAVSSSLPKTTHQNIIEKAHTVITGRLHIQRWAAIAIGVVLLLLAAIGVIGPDRVLAAVRSLFGYLPGIGFVEDAETVRVLSGPISLTQGGVTVTVTEAVADAESTRIYFSAEGISHALQFIQQSAGLPVGQRRLILPDGSEIATFQMWSVEARDTALDFQVVFQPLPQGTVDATLILGQIPGVPPEITRQDWRLPLHFLPGPASGRVLEAAPVLASSPEQQGISLRLESVAQTSGMAMLSVSVTVSDPTLALERDWENRVILEDADGSRIWLSANNSDLSRADTSVFPVPFLQHGARYTLKLLGPLEGFRAVSDDEAGSRFTLNLGVDPQPGQSWKLDQVIEAGGQRLHLSEARLLEGDACSSFPEAGGSGMSLAFDFDPQPGVINVMVTPLDSKSGASRVYTTACLVYPQTPKGVQTFRIANVTIPIEGVWTVDWQAP